MPRPNRQKVMQTHYNRSAFRLHLPFVNTPAEANGASESRVALDCQNRLIPSPPSTQKIDCFTYCGRDRSDGSFFDLFQPRREELDAVIGGIDSGGVAEPILTTGVQASLRCLVRQKVPLRDAVSEINRILWELAPESVNGTLLSARVDAESGKLRYINAGHHTAVVLRGSGRIDILEPNAPPLALNRNSCYREARLVFEPGDIFVTASGDIDLQSLNAVIARTRSTSRVRDWPADIGEAFEQPGPRIVIVICYRDGESRPTARPIGITPPVLQAVA